MNDPDITLRVEYLESIIKSLREDRDKFAIGFARFCQVDLRGRTFEDLMNEFKESRSPADSGDGLLTTGSNNRETKVESPGPQERECVFCKLKQTHNISQSMIDEAMSFIKLYTKESVSAPSESQEELWGEVFDLLETLDIPVNSENRGLHSEVTESLIKNKFTITRKPE